MLPKLIELVEGTGFGSERNLSSKSYPDDFKQHFPTCLSIFSTGILCPGLIGHAM